MSQWIALLLVPPVNVYELPTARWTVPSIFLVECDVLHVALDPRVAADAELPQPTRAVVGVEYFEQELLSQLRRRDDDPAVLDLLDYRLDQRAGERRRAHLHLPARLTPMDRSTRRRAYSSSRGSRTNA